jgi:hypothetical protein
VIEELTGLDDATPVSVGVEATVVSGMTTDVMTVTIYYIIAMRNLENGDAKREVMKRTIKSKVPQDYRKQFADYSNHSSGTEVQVRCDKRQMAIMGVFDFKLAYWSASCVHGQYESS